MAGPSVTIALTPDTVLLVTTASGQYEPYRPPVALPVNLYDDVEVPEYRPWEALGRHRPIQEEADATDEAFARRHRFPEVLEKRSKRRERERLVHERFKLKSTVERLRTSDNISSLLPPSTLPTSATREERNREMERLRLTMLAEAEETLKRYDELLEPRGTQVVEKPKRRPPTRRDSAPVAAAPGGKGKRPALEKSASSTINFKRDDEGTMKASSRASSVAPVAEATPSLKRGRQASSASKVELVDANAEDEAREPKRPRRAIVDTFFESAALREQVFPPAGSKRRQSGRVAYAFGVKLPDIAQDDFDYNALDLADAMGRA